MKKPVWITDAGHGWLKVDLRELVQAGNAQHSVSAYSYQHRGYAYLEEDSDAALYLETLTGPREEYPIEHKANSWYGRNHYRSFRDPFSVLERQKLTAELCTNGGA